MHAFSFYRAWLALAGLLVSAFGLALALGSRGELFAFFTKRVDPVFWGPAGPPAAALEFQSWIYGASGATAAGWGLMMAFLAWTAWGRREPWARYAMAVPLGLWFAVDTFYSLYHGVWINVGLNCLLLVVLGLPQALAWKSFSRPAP
ncbi:MAG: hypothetical protein K9K66_10510 [Desulfarculaceae bacterium]|nr:hypothetical protein [Desulfarculaceae bacterium]MCF8074082.1 hypothetical protein [Desulfarculaceae bacterium]MCF8102080.1 hypothetical protein [Desulfarculaceae bacterium]MCF8118118.1 hypothetical protein [Desulfarculaceae bacterium]